MSHCVPYSSEKRLDIPLQGRCVFLPQGEMKEYMEKHPEFVPKETKTTFLSKAEQKIKDRSAGKPDKPPV